MTICNKKISVWSKKEKSAKTKIEKATCKARLVHYKTKKEDIKIHLITKQIQ